MRNLLFTMVFLGIVALELVSRPVDTFYGLIEVEEPVLLELMDCSAMQRLKQIHQYGVSYYTTHREEYTRYAHSLGVFALLRKEKAPLKEQIAGLLHDVSHTVFSHVGDWIFGFENQEKDFQNQTHLEFLKTRGIESILEKYGYTAEEVLPTQELCPLLECSLPDLCADRIDYNIQGAYYRGFLTREEAVSIFHEIHYVDGIWVAKDKALMKKLCNFSYFMSKDCWGSPINHFLSRWLADAILRAKEMRLIGNEDILFGIDDDIWNLLQKQADPIIEEKMGLIRAVKNVCCLVPSSEADQIITSKFRGIDPWIQTQEGVFRLSSIDPQVAIEFNAARKCHLDGWPVLLRVDKKASFKEVSHSKNGYFRAIKSIVESVAERWHMLYALFLSKEYATGIVDSQAPSSTLATSSLL